MKKIFLIILIGISLTPAISFAADTSNPSEYKLLEPLPCIDEVNKNCDGGLTTTIDLNTYILYIYKFAIAVSVFLAIIMIIWGGFLYITSEVPFIKTEGKSKITNAVTGLLFVLVSYLILLTIDPRLVNIDSNIPPIEYKKENLEAVSRFKTEIEADLRKINTENREKVVGMNNQINELKKKREEIDNLLSSAQISPAEALVRYREIDAQLKPLQTKEQIAHAENLGLTRYADALSMINDPAVRTEFLDNYTAPTVPNTTGTTPRPTNSLNKIQNDYNTQINELLKTNSSPDKVQELDKQRDFFIAQIKEDKELEEIITKRWTSRDYRNDLPLKSKLEAYSKNVANPEAAKASGLTPDQYKKIIRGGIVKINHAFEVFPPQQ
ncbi:MAG: pilin [Candidatus Taylorbacteria bacterium]|nr:pilin [Candidatus Taylorbacteria bacterium]